MALRALAGIGVSVLLCLMAGAATGQPAKTAAAGAVNLLGQTEEIPGLLKAGKITVAQIPNPHWRADACLTCHRSTPSARDTALRGKDSNGLCQSCHESILADAYHHAVGMTPSVEKNNQMPEPFRQAVKRGGGVVSCITCHDLPMQCKTERFSEKSDNRRFLRGGPYLKRTDLCFNCHNPKHYERLNPHDQISDKGELNQQVCLVCHSEAPARRDVTSINDVKFTVTEDLTQLCTGCHAWRPHPALPFGIGSSGPNHLVKPSPGVLKQMKATERSDKLILPLEPVSGRVFCATCHNPHERGVQLDPRADVGADEVNRLRRLPGKLICMSCHDI